MKIFLKLLPYLIILSLGFGIYYGFGYLSNELSQSKELNVQLRIENSELNNRIDNLSKISSITINQLEQMRKNEKDSLKYINETNNKIDNLKLNEDSNELLIKINQYEDCMAKNSLNPKIKCELNIQ